MNLLKIKSKSESIGLTLKDLCEKIGMSYQNLNRCVRENKISANDLEKIAEVLGVSVGYFFEEEWNEKSGTTLSNNKVIQNGHSNNISISQKDNEIEKLNLEIEYLKRENELLREFNKKQI